MSSLVLLVLGQCLSLGPSWQEARVPVPPCPGTAPRTSRDSPGACGIQACSRRSDGCGQTGSNSASAEGLGWGPWGALGRGDPAPVVSRWLRLGWAVQQHWGARGLCSRGCFSSGCGAPWSLELTGICGPSCAPQGPVGQGQAALGPSWRRPMCPPGARRSGDAPAAWPQHVGTHVLGKRVPGNFLGISQGELGSGNFLPSPFSPPSSLTHCSRGHKRL